MHEKKKFFLLIFSVLWVIFLHGNDESLSYHFNDEYHENYILENGLQVFLIQKNTYPGIFFSIILPFGAQNEGISGATDLIKNLIFSKDHNSERSYVNFLQSIDASYDFEINFDHNLYYFLLHDESELEQVMQIEQKIRKNLPFEEKNFLRAKSDIIEQNRYIRDYQIEKIAQERLLNNIFYGVKLPNICQKTVEIEKLTYKNLRQFLQNNLQLCNSKLTLIGNFNIEKTKKIIQELYGEKNSNECNAVPNIDSNINCKHDGKITLEKKDSQIKKNQFIRYYQINSLSNYFAIDFLLELIKKTYDHYLHVELKLTHHSLTKNLQYIAFQAEHIENLEDFSKKLNLFLQKMKENKIIEQEFSAVKKKLIRKYIYLNDDFKSLSLLYTHFIKNDLPIYSLRDIYEKINKIDVSDIHNLISSIENNDFAEAHLYHD